MNRIIVTCEDLSLEELLREDSDSLPSSRLTLDEMTAPGEGSLFPRYKVCVNMNMETKALVCNYYLYKSVR